MAPILRGGEAYYQAAALILRGGEALYRAVRTGRTVLSKRTKIVAGVYLLGYVLIYFGIPQSIIELCGTGQWKYQPETEFFGVLVGSAVTLIRPFLAVWVIAIPVVFVWGLWCMGADLFRSFSRRLFHRDHE